MSQSSIKWSLGFLIILIVVSILTWTMPSLLYLGDSHHLEKLLKPPSLEHWFGTDQFGRDVFIRVLQASSVSLGIAFMSTFISIIVGATLGIISQFMSSRISSAIGRLTNIMLSIPSLLLGAIFILILGNTLVSFIGALGLGHVPFFIRIVRAQIFPIKESDFIQVSRLMGASSLYILKKHLIPHIKPMLRMQGIMSLPGAILASSSLNFLGLGMGHSIPEWGSLIYQSQPFIDQAPFLFLSPITVLIMAMFAIYNISHRLGQKDL